MKDPRRGMNEMRIQLPRATRKKASSDLETMTFTLSGQPTHQRPPKEIQS